MAHAATPHGRIAGSTSNMPELALIDRLGILVAIVGTIILVVIAAGSSHGLSAQQGLGSINITGEVVRIAIAGALGLINLANVVGLVLFASVGYRGPWHQFFVYTSFWGTLIAIPVALLV